MTDPNIAPGSAVDPLMEGAGGPPGVKFPNIGDSVAGVVVEVKERDDVDMDTNEVKKWPDGNPVKVYVMILDTDGTDEGLVSLWVRGNMVKAIRDAVTAAGLKSSIGQKLTVQHHALGDAKKAGFNKPKLFRAKVEAAPIRQPPAAVDGEGW